MRLSETEHVLRDVEVMRARIEALDSERHTTAPLLAWRERRIANVQFRPTP